MSAYNVELTIETGRWSAVVRSADGTAVRLAGTGARLGDAARAQLLARLQARPIELYRLLQGEPAPAVAALLPPLPDDAAAEDGSEPPRALAEAVREALTAEPLLRLALAGLPRAELLAGVFGSWAEELAAQGAPRRAPAAEPAVRGEARGAAGAVGDWIAEAAAAGTLHQPGPGFSSVEVRLPQELQPQEPPAGLAALLPGQPRAAEGLALVRARTAEAARTLAAGAVKPPR
ncbi:hypothetical protein Q5741_09565 [Paenibacillus sp. JX-17]|uniref:Uncharacterized protein n=1 Tax=Paenibacillus lacisoli TaxID=3064525 RepID=A0ABT9CDL4_9BACL|nr:hypothetical protein [Paenibacillus sp. JX-17]MDO7906668.1 hypothetical protein [Paenibacillus sp. JX-17]